MLDYKHTINQQFQSMWDCMFPLRYITTSVTFDGTEWDKADIIEQPERDVEAPGLDYEGRMIMWGRLFKVMFKLLNFNDR